MQRDSGTTAVAQWSPVTRRQAILGVGTLATGSVAVAAVGSGGARADVSVDSFDVPDASFEAEAVDPVADVTVSYSYDVANASVQTLDIGLLVGGDEVAGDELSTGTQALENDTTLSGPIADSSAWSASDFAVDPGTSVEREVEIGVTFDVLDTAGDSIVSASASDTATVVVDHPQDEPYTASVGGVGEIVTEG